MTYYVQHAFVWSFDLLVELSYQQVGIRLNHGFLVAKFIL